MDNFLKYLGALIVLVGVVFLAVYYFSSTPSNVLLVIAGICMVVGCIGHILLNKYIK